MLSKFEFILDGYNANGFLNSHTEIIYGQEKLKVKTSYTEKKINLKKIN